MKSSEIYFEILPLVLKARATCIATQTYRSSLETVYIELREIELNNFQSFQWNRYFKDRTPHRTYHIFEHLKLIRRVFHQYVINVNMARRI